MRIAITGATGNVGTSVLAALSGDETVEEIVGIARRRPGISLPAHALGLRGRRARRPHRGASAGADAVVHLAWLIQPSRDRRDDARSSTSMARGAYSRRPLPPASRRSSTRRRSAPTRRARRTVPVDESWPTGGIPTSFYSRDKSDVEAILDTFERAHQDIRVVRLRPGLIFKGDAASGIRRLFAGPLLPTPLLRRRLIPIVPAIERLRFQGVHSLDIGEAYRLALMSAARGAFNVAADPVLDSAGARPAARRAARPRATEGAADGGRPVAGGCACSPRPPAGWTSRSACR